MKTTVRMAAAVTLLLAPAAFAARPVGTIRTGGGDATRDVRAWHDAHHRTCGFERVVAREPQPAEDNAKVERWIVEACRGALYAYRVSVISMGSGKVVMVSDFDDAAVAHVPGTEGEPRLSSQAPADKVAHADRTTFDEAIAPYVAQARATWPDAKARYLAGLPNGHIFFVTVKLQEGERWEQAFIRVDRIDGLKIQGRIANQLSLATFHANDPIDVTDADVLDWTISRPDGSEEGNVVGKFLDGYTPDA